MNEKHNDSIKIPARIRKLLLEGKAVEMLCIVPSYASETCASTTSYLTQAVGAIFGGYEVIHNVSTREQLLGDCKDCIIATDVMFVRKRSIDALMRTATPAQSTAKTEPPKPAVSFTATYKTMDPRWTQRESLAILRLRYFESARKRIKNREYDPIGPSSMVHLPKDTHRRAKHKANLLGFTLSRYVTTLVEKDLENKE